MTPVMGERSLVCRTCWRSLFSTADFRNLCQLLAAGSCSRLHEPEYTTTRYRVEKNAAAGCAWCSLILAGINSELASRSVAALETGVWRISVSISEKDSVTPAGFNAAFVTINHSTMFRLTMFTTDSDPVGEFITSRDLVTELSSPKASNDIINWLVECDEHEECRPLDSSLLPSRVIEVKPEDHPDVPRLFKTNNTVGLYSALSYCWGSNQAGLTKKNNLETRLQMLDVKELPQTIRDAISTTKSIGIKYLWVDAVCIIQDSQEDKEIELASMCRIYRNATVTIVAAQASSANEGFLSDRAAPEPSFKIPFWSPSGELGSVSLRYEVFYNEDTEAINSRAWTLQEQLLSQRLLLYATHTLQYQCQHHTVNLGNSIHASSHVREVVGAEDASVQAVGRAWGNIVIAYSQRQLSFIEDRLTALAGVAEDFMSRAHSPYLAGLWAGELLPRLLLWRVHLDRDYAASPVYLAPSWSWASVISPVKYTMFTSLYSFEWYGVNVLSTHITLDNEALPFGRVRNGYLVLDAWVRKGFMKDRTTLQWSPLTPSQDSSLQATSVVAELDDPSLDGTDVLCLAIARLTSERRDTSSKPTIDGLLISPVEEDGGAYRRVGIFSGLQETEFRGLGFTRETLTVV